MPYEYAYIFYTYVCIQIRGTHAGLVESQVEGLLPLGGAAAGAGAGGRPQRGLEPMGYI